MVQRCLLQLISRGKKLTFLCLVVWAVAIKMVALFDRISIVFLVRGVSSFICSPTLWLLKDTDPLTLRTDHQLPLSPRCPPSPPRSTSISTVLLILVWTGESKKIEKDPRPWRRSCK